MFWIATENPIQHYETKPNSFIHDEINSWHGTIVMEIDNGSSTMNELIFTA